MLCDYLGLDLSPSLDQKIVGKIASEMRSKRWGNLVSGYRNLYLSDPDDHPVSKYFRTFDRETKQLADPLPTIESFENPLAVLAHYTHKGVLPPPELLCLITEIYEVYQRGKGEYALEELMFGVREKKNAPKNKALQVAKNFEHAELIIALGSRGSKSKAEVAEDYVLRKYGDLPEDQIPDPDHLLRSVNKRLRREVKELVL